ncbi:MAG: hypothetical protein KF900_02540 [Bacteroidetes bacterium]|nr:hypothetical protein [Bacteroidota bacterium]
MKIQLFILLFLSSFIGYPQSSNNKLDKNAHWIKIMWTDNLSGDFSFKENWSYREEGVYVNIFGQLSCDGICPPEIDRMKNGEGKIFEDSLTVFYKVLDTTPQFHSIKSDVSTYEYFNSDFINFKKQPNNSILGWTVCNVSTHSSLNIKLVNDSLTAWIDFNSIAHLGEHIFLLKEGCFKLDKTLFSKRIIKTEFYFLFKNTIEPKNKMYWKGLIYSEIQD